MNDAILMSGRTFWKASHQLSRIECDEKAITVQEINRYIAPKSEAFQRRKTSKAPGRQIDLGCWLRDGSVDFRTPTECRSGKCQ